MRGVSVVAIAREFFGPGWTGAQYDQLIEKMERQLKRQKEKRKDHKVQGLKGATSAAMRRGRGTREETYEEVVRRTLRG